LDRPLALSVNVMLEGWADESAPGIGPMGNPLRAGVLDLQARSWAAYGPKVGAWRILDALAQAGASAVFYVSGILAERYPDLMKAIVAAGHDIAAHSWAQNIVPAYQSEAEEAEDLQRCVAAIEAASGRRPNGWLSPRCTPSLSTSGLLAKSGFLWHADTFDSDTPYLLDTAQGRILAMPFTMEVNDMPLYIRYGCEPEAFTRILERLLSRWPELGPRPACLDITVHAHVFGRPYGIIELTDSLRLARRHEATAWLTNHRELTRLFAKLTV
jgi:peptidoglycan/xylan/chitin deacetylase (PgdA/CDA1 family)